MKLPTEAQLSREQKEVCFAPTERTILVVGPPGSGKTVVAIFRQNALRKQRRSVQALVYNRVLKRYTGIDSTFYEWINSWWKKATGRSLPSLPRDEPGCYDFHSARDQAAGSAKSALMRKGNWGHLILDEAQDFAPVAHEFLCYVRELVFAALPEEEKPSLTILADENQRITATNSTMGQIRAAHLLTDDDVYRLEHNYRNTREIAKLAAVFYTGLESGKPKLPTHRGDKPKLVITDDIGDAVKRIVEYVRVYDKEDLGVLVMYNATRKKFFNRLTARLQGKAIRVQTYTSDGEDEHHDIERLKFDKGGSITILCFASSKGLEFDAVFLPELQTVNVANDETQTTLKSNLYVMCSRARKRLFLMVSDSERGSPIWSILPQSQELMELET